MEFLSGVEPQVVAGQGGTMYVWRPAPTIVVGRVVGKLTSEAARTLEVILRRCIDEDGRHLGFHDWEAMTDYDFADRARLTAAVARAFQHTDGLHFLTGSRIVRFGVEAANVVLKRLTVHGSRESFEQAVRQAVALRRRGGTHAVEHRP